MKFSVLASGSKGNCTYIETINNKVLVDLGMTCLYVERCLGELGVKPSSISSVFLTHTHVDHVSGLKVFIKKYHPTVFLTKKMYKELSKTMVILDYVLIDDKVILDDLVVDVFKTSHDAEDSVGFVFKSSGRELVYITDTGYINVKNHKLLKDKDIYVIESNHDVQLLMDNPKYPYHIKQRILSDKGHLSNKDSANYVSKFISSKTKCVVLIHLSENNNEEDIALTTMKNKLKNFDGEIIISHQNERTELVDV